MLRGVRHVHDEGCGGVHRSFAVGRVCRGLSAVLLAAGKALVTVNLSVGYAIWAALGIVLTSIIAVVMFGEQLNVPSIVGIALIVAGVVLVNMFGPAH